VARFLALDWDQNRLHIIAANLSGGKVVVQRAAVWQEELTPNPANLQEVGQKLRQRLKSAGIAPAPVLACIGRDRVILKELRFPVVPESEEPAMVRFQAVKEIVDSPDDVVIDYMPIWEQSSSAQRRAQALIVRREVVSTYQEMCQAAGLKLTALTPRSFGMIACLRQVMGSSPLTPPPEPADGAIAVVVIGERLAELCIFRGETPLLYRSLPVTPQLAGEVRRSMAVYDGQFPSQTVAAVYVAGQGTPEVRQRLVELVEVPVHTFDPFAQSDVHELATVARGTFAAAVGLLFAQARAGQLPINFAQPRQPVVKARGVPSRKLVYGLVAALVLFVGASIVARGQANKLLAEEEEVKLQRKSVENDLANTQQELKRLKALYEWDTLCWLDELYELARRIPDVNELRITSMTTRPLDQKGAKSRFAAVYTLEGKVLATDKRPSPIDQLVDEFNKKENAYYSAESPDLRVDETTKELRFTLRVFVERRAPDEYLQKLVPPPPPKAVPGEKGKWREKGKDKGKRRGKGMRRGGDEE
jgi:Tfp pilus assembly PilM family ATPase